VHVASQMKPVMTPRPLSPHLLQLGRCLHLGLLALGVTVLVKQGQEGGLQRQQQWHMTGKWPTVTLYAEWQTSVICTCTSTLQQ
jgi:hypothetical protein